MKAGFVQFGSVCNLNRTVDPEDILSWIMIMQIYGASEGNLAAETTLQ